MNTKYWLGLIILYKIFLFIFFNIMEDASRLNEYFLQWCNKAQEYKQRSIDDLWATLMNLEEEYSITQNPETKCRLTSIAMEINNLANNNK